MLVANKIHNICCSKLILLLYLNCSPVQFLATMFLKLRHNKKAQVNFTDLADELLVSRYLELHDKELIAVLFERYTHLVYGICLNFLQDSDHSKDAVMEIFESLFHKLSAHQISNFRNWLYSVTRNHCLMILRKNGSIKRAHDKYKVEANDSELPEFLDEDDDLSLNKGMVISAVEQLNHEQGTCIRLMYIDDKSYRDISGITGYSMNEVKSHIQNGKRNIKNFLLKRDENHGT
jgi:RNA polymerase sigma factor (sigma-70 family)